EVAMTLSGVAGVGFLVDNYPHVLTVLKYLGAAYLIYFTFTCFRDAFKSEATALNTDAAPTVSPQTISTFDGTAHVESSGGHRASSITDADSLTAGGGTTVRTRPLTISPRGSATKVVLTALAFTWLNPAAYVDVVVMLGGIANQYGPDGRWLFGAGSVAAACVWFPLIGLTASRFADILAQPKVWRVINFVIGLIMIGITVKLLTH
ncbi:MAG: LysE family transporter, partial [Corynebacterium sp.]|nr:LysE family transporter [Corynebacterium sp.]